MTYYGHIMDESCVVADYVSNRLSGILHVLYSAIMKHLPLESDPDTSDPESPVPERSAQDFSRIIPKKIADMSVALTEYFQRQRIIYEDVSQLHIFVLQVHNA